MHVDDVGLRVEMVSRHVFEEHRAGYHPPGMAHQVFEQLELASLQLDHLVVAPDLVGQQVEIEVGDVEPG